ncbi:MAG: primosomal protein N' [Gammaproteobacteria bacterium]|nr:primosomal protein N' [Gammaproteobacteria bacterium]
MKNHKPTILRIAVPTPLRRSFDYLAPTGCDLTRLQPGMRVRIPFHNRQMVGILLEVCDQSEFAVHKLKQAVEIIDDYPVVSADVMQLCLWAAEYYHHPLGDVLETALPTLLRQGKPLALSQETYWTVTPEALALDFTSLNRSPRQQELLSWLIQHPEGVSKRQIKERDIPSTMMNTLCKKGWATKISKDDILIPSLEIPEPALTLNAAQQHAVTVINAAENFHVFLLDGVTGSGKTEVYLQAISAVLAKGKQVLVLVPEIGLTPQTLERFRKRFSVPVVALHSGLTDKERLNAFLNTQYDHAKIIIGTRSAIFSPFKNLGLIIVDEEHDLSFKQHDGFRYHARDLAIMRAQSNNISIVLGSATPSLETLCRTQQGRYQHLRLPERAGDANIPVFSVLDIRKQHLEEGISQSLLSAMKTHLDKGDQVMLFLNRRGFAPVFMCHSCGWMAKCQRCDSRLTYHSEPSRLHCHHCDSRRSIPKKCDACGENDLQIIGLGTERLEQALQKHFPNFSIARIDRDSTQRKGSMENLLEKIQSGEHQILIGTQMLAKGHHFPNVTLVGIIDTDGGFFSSDFRALERMGQLILQVAGRAGRVSKPGTVVLQTHHPDHPLLHQLLRESYHFFATTLLQERAQALLPPYAFLALFRAEAHDAEQAHQFLQHIKKITDTFAEKMSIWGPVAAPMAKRSGRYRMQLLFQADQRPLLQRYLKKLLPEIEKIPSKHQVRWSLDVDPLEMF